MKAEATSIQLAIAYEGTGATVTLGGEVDVQNANRLRAILQAALAMGSTSLTIDCQQVTFIDSTGLGVFAFAATETLVRGGTTTVANPSVTLQRMLHITGLDTVLGVR